VAITPQTPVSSTHNATRLNTNDTFTMDIHTILACHSAVVHTAVKISTNNACAMQIRTIKWFTTNFL